MSKNVLTAGITLSLVDKASAALAGAVSKQKAMLKSLTGKMSNDALLAQGNQAIRQAQQYASIMQTASIGAGALIGFQALNMNEFAKYQKGMAYISTLIEDTRFNFQAMGKDIMNISRQTGLELGDVQRAVYQAISSNIDPLQSTSFISDISQTALAGGVGLETAMNPIVTVLNAYGLSSEKAMWVSDKLFQTVKVGRVEFNQLSDTVAEFAQTGALGGLAIEELLGAFATLTNVGITPAEASTAINRFVLSIIDANDESKEFAKTKNLAFDFEHLREVGIVEFLNEIQTATHGDIVEIQKLFPEIRAFKGVAPLVGSAADMFKEFTKSVYDATGTTAKGAEKMANTLANKYDRMKASWKTLMVSMGGIAYDSLEGPINNIIEMMQKASENPETAKKISSGVNAGIGSLATVAGFAGMGLLTKNIVTMVSAFRLALQGGGMLTGGGALASGAWGAGKAALAGKALLGSAGGTVALAAVLTAAIMKGIGAITDHVVTRGSRLADQKASNLSGYTYQEFMALKNGKQDENAKAILEGKLGGEVGRLWDLYK